jgi:hypothetical protein
MEKIRPSHFRSRAKAHCPVDLAEIRQQRFNKTQQAAELMDEPKESLQSVFLFEKSRRGNRMVRFLLRFLEEPEQISLPEGRADNSVVAQSDGPPLAQCASTALDHFQSCKGLKWLFLSGTCIGKSEIARLQKVFPEYQAIYVTAD